MKILIIHFKIVVRRNFNQYLILRRELTMDHKVLIIRKSYDYFNFSNKLN